MWRYSPALAALLIAPGALAQAVPIVTGGPTSGSIAVPGDALTIDAGGHIIDSGVKIGASGAPAPPAPVSFAAPHTFLPAELGGNVTTTGSIEIPFTLPAPAAVAKGQRTMFEAGPGGLTLTTSEPASQWLGLPDKPAIVRLWPYGTGAAWSDGTNWHVAGFWGQ